MVDLFDKLYEFIFILSLADGRAQFNLKNLSFGCRLLFFGLIDFTHEFCFFLVLLLSFGLPKS